MSRFLRSGLFLGTLALSLGALSLTGCKTPATADADEVSSDSARIAFTMGAPIADSSIVAIIDSEYGSDTLRTALFRDQMGYILQRNQMLQGDTTQQRELRRSLVEGFVLQYLVEQESLRNDTVKVDTAMVNQQIQAYIAQAQGPENFQAQLASEGMTVDSLRTLIGTQMRQQALAESWAKAAPAPTATQILAFANEQAQEVRVQHIVWTDGGLSPAQRDSLLRVANAVLDTAKAGKVPFADLARRYGQDGTSATGGTLDYFNRSAQMDPKFLNAAFDLAEKKDSGAVTPELVKSQFGYHVIRLSGERMGTPMDTTMARTRMMETRSTEAVRARLKALVGERKVIVRVNPAIVRADLNAPLAQD